MFAKYEVRTRPPIYSFGDPCVGYMSWQPTMKTEDGAAYRSQLVLPAKQQTYMAMPLLGLLVPSVVALQWAPGWRSAWSKGEGGY